MYINFLIATRYTLQQLLLCVLVFLVVLNSANISTVWQIPVTGISLDVKKNDCIKVEMIT